MELPIPPVEMRQLVGPTEESAFDNPSGAPVLPDLPDSAWEFVLDFGCGCGRLARQMLQQRPRPRRYVGVDLHRGMVRWCQRNLAPRAPDFEFHHHDVRALGFNPKGRAQVLPLPVPDRSASLMIAWSVFTHLTEAQAIHYLGEAARVLRGDGILFSTWFLFDKSDFPMMQEFQNALFINDVDPTNAVIFDREWLRATTKRLGLVATRIVPPEVRGFQWSLRIEREGPGVQEAAFPLDAAPIGLCRPPLLPHGAARLGLDDDRR